MRRSARSDVTDEQVVLPMRTHASVLVVPAATLVLLGGVAGAGMALVPSVYRPVGQYVLAAGVILLALWWSVAPFLRWWGRRYTITTHRLVTCEGFLSRRGHSVPLARIHDVSYQRSLGERLLGCGTLVVQTAADGALVLHDVPGVGYAHQVLSDLVVTAAPHHDPAELDHDDADDDDPDYEDEWSAPAGRRR